MLLRVKTKTTGLDSMSGDKHIVTSGQDNLESLRQIMNREAKRLLHDLQADQLLAWMAGATGF